MLKKRLDEGSRKRIRAARLLQKGKKPAEVALALGVAWQTVYRWKALLDEGAHLGTQGADADHRFSLQLEPRV